MRFVRLRQFEQLPSPDRRCPRRGIRRAWQTTALLPMHAPFWQASEVVHALWSSQAVLLATGVAHVPAFAGIVRAGVLIVARTAGLAREAILERHASIQIHEDITPKQRAHRVCAVAGLQRCHTERGRGARTTVSLPSVIAFRDAERARRAILTGDPMRGPWR